MSFELFSVWRKQLSSWVECYRFPLIYTELKSKSIINATASVLWIIHNRRIRYWNCPHIRVQIVVTYGGTSQWTSIQTTDNYPWIAKWTCQACWWWAFHLISPTIVQNRIIQSNYGSVSVLVDVDGIWDECWACLAVDIRALVLNDWLDRNWARTVVKPSRWII